MAYQPTIYDWRRSLVPLDQVLRAGGEAVAGGLTLGGALIENPEPGGRAELMMAFPRSYSNPATALDVSWTISRILNGAILRVRLYASVQLVSGAALGAPVAERGQPWANGGPWGSGQNWAFEPTAPVAADATRGASQVQVDLSDFGEVLAVGHVVGFTLGSYSFAHVVMDCEYQGDTATLQISPPLRRSVSTGDQMQFRPSMLVQCRNGPEVMGGFGLRRLGALNAALFVEALV